MSIKVMSKVWELDIKRQKKFVLLAFADHADDRGICWPSQERIAWKCGFSEKSVKRWKDRLVEDGLLEIVEEAKGRGNPPKFKINTEKGDSLSPLYEKGDSGVQKGGQSDEKGDSGVQKGGQQCHPNHHESSKNHQEPKEAEDNSASEKSPGSELSDEELREMAECEFVPATIQDEIERRGLNSD